MTRQCRCGISFPSGLHFASVSHRKIGQSLSPFYSFVSTLPNFGFRVFRPSGDSRRSFQNVILWTCTHIRRFSGLVGTKDLKLETREEKQVRQLLFLSIASWHEIVAWMLPASSVGPVPTVDGEARQNGYAKRNMIGHCRRVPSKHCL